MNSDRDASEKEEFRTFYENQGPGIKEKCEIPDELIQQEVEITPEIEVVLIGPDSGKRKEKDEFFVPNVNNGLFRIHAFLHSEGIKSVMLDCYINNTEEMWEKIKKYSPPFIGFSPYYDTMQNDLQNIAKAIEASPESIIVIGGFEASLNPQWRSLGGLIDILIRGEGEFPLQEVFKEYKKLSNGRKVKKEEFLNYLKNDSHIREIPAISILEKEKKAELRFLPQRISEEDYQKINLNAFQEHLDLSPIKKYWALSRFMFKGKKDSYFRFITSDQCPYKCIFCQSSIHQPRLLGKESAPLRTISAENIKKIIATVSNKYPEMGMYIDDDNFLVNPVRAKEALNMIIEGKKTGEIRKDLIFQCRTRTDNITPEICALLKQAGCIMVSVGSESYSQKELDYMKKRTSPEQNLKAVKMILESGLGVAEDYLLYTPVVTKDTFYENARRICKNIGELNVDGSVNLFLSPLPSTELWGDGNFEKIGSSPRPEIFESGVMFRSLSNGYEYIGKEIYVPKLNLILPHPELVLVKDSLMREISLSSLGCLPETINKLKSIAPGARISRSFTCLIHIYTTSSLLYNLTKENRWLELIKEIEQIVKKWGMNNNG